MDEQFDVDQHDSISQTQPNLSQLKKQVQLTPSTLKEITYKQQFIDRVIELSNNAKESVNIERAKEALIYLNQAEKILEYAASCGKTIDKNIIISVLNNIACCYQKVWQLEKCSQYLQALIYNFNSFMKVTDQNTSSEDGSSQKYAKEKSKKMEELVMIEILQKRTFLAKYYLQFCAVNSQTDNHSGALVAGRKSIEIVKGIFKQLADYTPNVKKMTYQKKSQYQYKIKLITLGARLNDAINVNNYQTIFQATKYYLRQWKITKDSKDRADRNYVLQEEFKNYSIGNAMQIVALGYKDFQLKEQKTFTSKMVLEKIILMALGYFTISTELRLIANKKVNKKEGSKCSNTEFKQSQIYHLLSIIIAASCIPFEILYMKHVLSSYNNHYGNDLLIQNENQSKISLSNFQEIVFPILKQQQVNKKYPINNSFTESVSHEETISKYEKDYNVHNISNEKLTHRRNESNFKEEDHLKQEASKKMKLSIKNKNKSKSKLKTMHFVGFGDKSQKASPIPKSPQMHMKSPSQKNNLIKVKTSYKLKVSTEKIVTTTNPNNYKDEKSKKKKETKETRAENIQIDYYMGRSKDLKKSKKIIDNAYNLNSPKATSRSNSKRQSPIPKYFETIKSPLTIGMKNMKSPKKQQISLKSAKSNIYQHYS